jgi:flagellar basal body-associated protein FliL
MADEEQYLDDEREAQDELETGKKRGFLPGFLLQVLKWILIGLAVVIGMVTIAFVTFNILMPGRVPLSPQEESAEYRDLHTVYNFYKNIKPIRGLTADDPPKTFIAELTIGYRKGRTAVQTELIDRTDQIENIILLFLGQKRANELRTQDAEELQEQIKNKINHIMVEKIDLVLFKELQAF